MENKISVVKDEENERPIPTVWRSKFVDIINSFVKKDYCLTEDIDGVTPISKETADQIKEYIEDYGEELVQLSDETWESSVYIWMETHWDVLVDLWIAAEGEVILYLGHEFWRVVKIIPFM